MIDCSTAWVPSCVSCQQVKELQEQVHQLESRLSNVQLALKQAQAKTTSQTQQFTASVSSMDAMSPSQSLQASPGGGHKKPRSEQTQAMSGQRSPAQDARAGGTLDSGAAAQSGSDYAASPSGAVRSILLRTAVLRQAPCLEHQKVFQ